MRASPTAALWRLLVAAGCGLLLASCGSPPQTSTPTTPAADRNLGPRTFVYDGGQVTVESSRSPCRLTLRGSIHNGTVKRMGQALGEVEKAGCGAKELVLDGSDGVIGDAITLGAMLKNRGYQTALQPGSQCGTPCLLVFAAGRERLVPEAPRPAQLAFTQIPPDQDFGRGVCETELTPGQAQTLTRYLRAMLPPATAQAVYQRLLAADCRTTARLGPAEALALGLATATR